jgi:hypothetical protein
MGWTCSSCETEIQGSEVQVCRKFTVFKSKNTKTAGETRPGQQHEKSNKFSSHNGLSDYQFVKNGFLHRLCHLIGPTGQLQY